MGKVETRKRRVWRRTTYIWTLGGLAAISALIYWEQTALLFVLSTLAMCVLLMIVALANLEARDKEMHKHSDGLNPGTESNSMEDAPIPVQVRKRRSGTA